MKLSEMSTEQLADALMVITPEIQPILLDAGLMAELRKSTKDKGKALEVGLQKVAYLIPVILGKYRENVFRIMGVLSGKTPEEIAAQNLLITIKQAQELFQDKELLDFFSSLKPAAQGK